MNKDGIDKKYLKYYKIVLIFRVIMIALIIPLILIIFELYKSATDKFSYGSYLSSVYVEFDKENQNYDVKFKSIIYDRDYRKYNEKQLETHKQEDKGKIIFGGCLVENGIIEIYKSNELINRYKIEWVIPNYHSLGNKYVLIYNTKNEKLVYKPETNKRIIIAVVYLICVIFIIILIALKKDIKGGNNVKTRL